MKPSIVAKLEALHERHEEVQALLGDAGIIADQDRFRALSREYAQLSDVSRCFTDWQQVQDDIETAQMMLDDPEMREMAQEELREAKEKANNWSNSYRYCCCRKIRTMNETRSLRFAPYRRRRSRAVCRRSVPHVQPLCRSAPLARGDHEHERRRAWRL